LHQIGSIFLEYLYKLNETACNFYFGSDSVLPQNRSKMHYEHPYFFILPFRSHGWWCNFLSMVPALASRKRCSFGSITEILPLEDAQSWWYLQVLQRLIHAILILRNSLVFKICTVFLLEPLLPSCSFFPFCSVSLFVSPSPWLSLDLVLKFGVAQPC